MSLYWSRNKFNKILRIKLKENKHFSITFRFICIMLFTLNIVPEQLYREYCFTKCHTTPIKQLVFNSYCFIFALNLLNVLRQACAHISAINTMCKVFNCLMNNGFNNQCSCLWFVIIFCQSLNSFLIEASLEFHPLVYQQFKRRIK